MAVGVLLQCFIADEEMFPAGERFAGPELIDYIDKNGKPGPTSRRPSLPHNL